MKQLVHLVVLTLPPPLTLQLTARLIRRFHECMEPRRVSGCDITLPSRLDLLIHPRSARLVLTVDGGVDA